MQDLIKRLTAVTGLDETRAEEALGIVLTLIRTQGHQQKVDALFERLPGAQELAARGGLMGGPLVAMSRLQAAGLSMAQIKSLGSEVLAYAKEKAGDQAVRDAAGSIPGLSAYL
jgi:hypothetical protein